MEITAIRINAMDTPVGFAYDMPRCSWMVDSYEDIHIGNTRVEVATDEAFTHIVWMKEGGDVNGLSEPMDFKMDPRTRYHVRVTVESTSGETAQSTTFFETGKMDEPWVATWVGMNESGKGRRDGCHPEFVRDFQIKEQVSQARLYISGLGLFEADIDGHKIGSEVLTPYLSDYAQEVQSLTFDITSMLQTDATSHRMAVRLGDGWYKGRFGLAGMSDLYGDTFLLIAELHICYADGTETIIGTDGSWRYHGSDVEDSGIYDGEVVNRMKWAKKDNPWKTAVPAYLDAKLVDRYSLPVEEHEVMPVSEVIHTPNGETVLDFGQNFSGYVIFHADLPKGCHVVLDYGEILQRGNFCNANYRTAKARFEYTSDGREEDVKPSFTYFGFRYVRVEGWPEPLDPNDFMAKAIYSSLRRTGYLETGSSDVNQLYSNVLWGQRSNFVDIPTDCPQRDERLGWTGDAQVFCGTASYTMDTAAFYRRFLRELRGQQRKLDGAIPGVIPMLDPHGSAIGAVWGDIATFMPTVLFDRYGDVETLRESYPMMCDWVDWIARNDAARGAKYLFDFCDQLGDWLALDGRTPQSMKGGTDDFFISSCYWAESVRKTADVAGILGIRADEAKYRNLYGKIRQAVLDEYYTSTGRLSIDTQTGYVVALYTRIYPDGGKPHLIEAFRERLYKDCYTITGGFVGAPIMCRVMADNGMADEAMNLLLSHDFPGWMHCIDLGATTIWERWNSVLDDGMLSGTMMNSLNHYAFGSVVEYLYRNVCGLTAMEPGFKKAQFAPLPDARLGHCSLIYDSVSGRYRSEWRILRDGRLHVLIQVPFDCSAQIVLPFYGEAQDEPMSLGAGVHEFTYQPTRDLMARYSSSTLFKNMSDDDEAMSIIEREAPMLYQMMSSGDRDYLNDSLNTLHTKFFMGFDDKLIARLSAGLLALRIGKNED